MVCVGTAAAARVGGDVGLLQQGHDVAISVLLLLLNTRVNFEHFNV
jgi:hypothetical protein